ncbi:hypothetical protein [Streptomyces sp. NPDC002676]
MLKLRKTRRALAMTVATIALAGGMSTLSAGPASATSYVCVPLSSGVDTSQCSHTSTLHTGSEWTPTTTFNSAFTYLRFQGDGNLVLYCKYSGYSYGLGRNVSAGQAVWASGFTNSGTRYNADKWDFWSDGNMATYGSYQAIGSNDPWHVTWNTQTWYGSDTIAIVQTDGNFVLWEGGVARWASNTYHYCPGSQDYWNGYR